MKTGLKIFGSIFLILTLSGAGFAYHEWTAEKPFMFNNFLNRTLFKQALDSPETLTSLGFLESIGITGHNAELDDDSPSKTQELFDELPIIRKTLMSYDDLDKQQELSKEVTVYLLDMLDDFKRFQYHNYPVNQLFGLQSNFPSFMDAQHRVSSVEDAENYIQRLSKVPKKFAQNLESLKIREFKEIHPPSFVIDRVLEEMKSFVEQPTEENILYSSLLNKIEKANVAEPETFSDTEIKRILADTKNEIERSVKPAYQTFIDYFTHLRQKGNQHDGFWSLPGGEEAYKLALSFFTTTDYSADHIHQIGLSEVDRIQKQILQILEANQYDVSNGFSAAIETLAADPSFYYSDDQAGREQILKDYQKILDEIDAGINSAFNIRPKAGMEVVRIPEFKEKTSPGAYYQQPAIDGSRPGRFFANLYDIKATPKYGMRTLAYHEGIPGHHFQIAIAMELEGLPFIRKMAPFTAYTEGWALYSEQVAWEMGFQKDPFDNIGRLQAELFRAVRLVVDTGIHAKKWTRQQAIDYMKTNTGIAESDVVSEIERYIVMPGQATAYKVGMMKILEIRAKAKIALGDAFDLAEFHDVVLKNGPLPLDILDRVVGDFVKKKLSAKGLNN
jgi:uncharacterized protein (DUF885 family)